MVGVAVVNGVKEAREVRERLDFVAVATFFASSS